MACRTFHSFRHNFITALTALDPPISEFQVNQLSGHERGETMSGKRYAKDQAPDVLAVHVARLNFTLPDIAVLEIEDAVLALKAALARKHAVPHPGAMRLAADLRD